MKNVSFLLMFITFLPNRGQDAKLISIPYYQKDAYLHEMQPRTLQLDNGFEKKVNKTKAVSYQSNSSGYYLTSVTMPIKR